MNPGRFTLDLTSRVLRSWISRCRWLRARGGFGYSLALTRALMMARTLRKPTMATPWPPRTIRLTSTAGRQLSSPLRMMNAPTGRGGIPKPLPDPLPPRWGCVPLLALAASATRTTLDAGGGDDGHPVLLVRLAEHSLDREGVPCLGDDVLDLHGLLPSLAPSSILPAGKRLEPSICTLLLLSSTASASRGRPSPVGGGGLAGFHVLPGQS